MGRMGRSHDPMQISQICWPVPRILISFRLFIWLCVPGAMPHHIRLLLDHLNTAHPPPLQLEVALPSAPLLCYLTRS